ncbi:hypothetical protein VaNZ11_011418 [Volvox africanus]|uniref:Uncharacterized protein n=1 Tax=Volvox africanus TaxID=51714 RepID=A0ABQ5SC45_9CHLO|nr:hypothetical protein VaNZ11_011418 [Volvox africanus]
MFCGDLTVGSAVYRLCVAFGRFAVVTNAQLKLPTVKGLSGGWQIDFTGNISGARFIHPINTDKDGSLVAARVASALSGLSVAATSDVRALSINPTRMADAAYVEDAANYVVNQLYGTLAQAGTNPLLQKTTLVLSSVHRYGLYVAEALHARVLPLQYISFANSWQQVVNASSSATIIVGQDYDYGGLWLWNKIAAGKAATKAANVPTAYLQAMKDATNIIVVQPCDNWVYCNPVSDPQGYNCWDAINETYIGGTSGPIYLHTSLSRSGFGTGGQLYQEARAKGAIGKASAAEVKNLKQWEWGVPDSTVNNLKTIWTQTLKRSETNFKVISGGVVDMFTWTPDVWRSYLESANKLKVRGFHWNSYWVAHTQLERMAAVLPFPSYSYYQPYWHPLDDKARSVLNTMPGAPNFAASYAANSRAFVNSIGSAYDADGVKRVLSDYGLTPGSGLAYYGFGIDAAGASSVGWDGTTNVRAGYVEAAVALQNATLAPYTKRVWMPLVFANFTSAPSVCGAWTPY